jgi:hypothetical protein
MKKMKYSNDEGSQENQESVSEKPSDNEKKKLEEDEEEIDMNKYLA